VRTKLSARDREVLRNLELLQKLKMLQHIEFFANTRRRR
jgi:hypothetical protein